MKTEIRLQVRLLVLAGCLAFVAALSERLVVVHAQSAEETEIRLVVQKFLTALQKKDSATLTSIRSERPPSSAGSERPSQRSPDELGDMDLNTLRINEVTAEATEATARVSVKANTGSLKDSKADERLQQTNLTVHLIKETGVWKVRSYRSSEEELADAIAAAKSDDERKRLVDRHQDLITARFDKALLAMVAGLINKGDYSQAQGLLETTRQIADRINDSAGAAGVSRASGDISYAHGEYQKALAMYQESLRAYELAGNQEGIASAFIKIGGIHRVQGRNAEALDFFQKSLKIDQEIGDRKGTAAALNSIGLVQDTQGNYPLAVEALEKSLGISEEIGDGPAVAASLSALGRAHYFHGDYPEALSYYQRALKTAQDLGLKARIATALNGVGIVMTGQGNYSGALEQFQQSLSIRQELGDKAGAAGALNNIATIQFSRGNYTQALQYFEMALRSAEELGRKPEVATLLLNIADLYLLQGSASQAQKYFTKSLDLARAAGNKPDVASVLFRMADLERVRGNMDESRKFLDEGLKLAEEAGQSPLTTVALESLGAMEVDAGHYDKGTDYLKKCLALREQLGDKQAIAETLSRLGDVYATQRAYPQAIECEERAAAITRQMRTPELIFALTVAAGAYRALGKPDQARKALLEAIAAVEQLRGLVAGSEQERLGFLERKIAPYYAMASLLIDQNDPLGAFAFAEQAKARALIDVLESGRGNLTRAMTAEEKDREQNLNTRLGSLNAKITSEKVKEDPDEKRVGGLTRELEQARLEYEAFRAALYVAHPELKVQRAEFQPISLAECGALVPDRNTALLEFAVADDQTYLFILAKNNPSQALPDLKLYKINIKSKDLTDLCSRFHDQLSQHSLDFDALARKLHDLLLGPAAAELQARTNLVIVPDGPLWDLPFQALEPAPRHYVIEAHALSFAPSLTALREMSKRSRVSAGEAGAPGTLLALGNPALSSQTASEIKEVFMDANLAPLPGAETQVKELARIYGSAHSKIYTGAEATEDRLKSEAPGARVVHIAAHGIVNNTSPMYSQLVLSRGPGSDDDGVLEAWEIMNMDLKADLVVLAACDTARGRFGAGEGMIGLSWAFFIAGCPTTVVSQWSVESESTSRLMVEFHRNLKSGLTRAEALRRAELKLLKGEPGYRDPFYWAPFVVIGAGN
jgi:CHAT domain-containing protein/Tfp pilus assembly protein PilF